jgi:hypothetical protein
MFLYLLVTWRTKQQAKNAQSWPRDFLALTPSVQPNNYLAFYLWKLDFLTKDSPLIQ